MTSDTPLATLMLTADPQIGLYGAALGRAEAKRAQLAASGGSAPVFDALPTLDGFEREVLLFDEAIAAANEIRPDAVVVCGDMLQDWDSDEQTRVAIEATQRLDDGIPLYWVSGNHDVAPDTYRPTEEALARYRERFGIDRYVAEVGAVRLIVMNSTVVHSDALPAERLANLEFLEAELTRAADLSQQPIVASHHPWFLRDIEAVPADPVTAMEMPPAVRHQLLDIASAGGLRTLLTGHLHQHLTRTAGDLLQITTSAIGLPFARHPSGYQVVRIYADRVEHEACDLPSGPGLHEEAGRIWAARQYPIEE